MPPDRNIPDVAADMARIFAPLAGRSIPTATNVDPADRGDAGSQRSSGKRVLFVAPLLVLLAGGALASIYIVNDGLKTPPASRTIAAPTSPETAGASKRGPGAGPAAATARTTSDTGQERSSDIPDDASVREDRTSIATAPGEQRRREATGETVAQRNEGDGARSRSDCEPGSLEDRCIYQDVLNADDRLRRAFDRARRSGVPSARLTVVQRRWTLARDAAESDPDGTIRRYDQLADLLDRERDEVVE
jgi:uncharacterized protein YecT (DUF1311 family)